VYRLFTLTNLAQACWDRVHVGGAWTVAPDGVYPGWPRDSHGILARPRGTSTPGTPLDTPPLAPLPTPHTPGFPGFPGFLRISGFLRFPGK